MRSAWSRGSRKRLHPSENHPKQVTALAEREGFEPSMRCRIHTFQACSFDRSDTSPGWRWLAAHGPSAKLGRAAIRPSRIPAHALAATVAPFRAWRGSQPDVAGGPDWTAIDPAIRAAQSSGSWQAKTGGARVRKMFAASLARWARTRTVRCPCCRKNGRAQSEGGILVARRPLWPTASAAGAAGPWGSRWIGRG